MAQLAAFPDIEQALWLLLPNAVDGLTAGSVTPADLASHLPFARVICHGGGDDSITDTSRVTIDIFAATRAAAMATAETVRQYLTQPGGPGDPFDIITTDSKPQDIPWNDANNPRRVSASYRVDCRRQDASSDSSSS